MLMINTLPIHHLNATEQYVQCDAKTRTWNAIHDHLSSHGIRGLSQASQYFMQDVSSAVSQVQISFVLACRPAATCFTPIHHRNRQDLEEEGQDADGNECVGKTRG